MKPKSRKPLIYWCRWHDATLRLRGRDATHVWGEFVYNDDGEVESFRYDTTTWQLVRGDNDPVQLDEMGVER